MNSKMEVAKCVMLVIVSFLALSAYADSRTLAFSPTSLDLGPIPDSTVTKASVVITNTSSQECHFDGVKVSCGCTVVDFVPQDLAPGASTTITVSIDPSRTTSKRNGSSMFFSIRLGDKLEVLQYDVSYELPAGDSTEEESKRVSVRPSQILVPHDLPAFRTITVCSDLEGSAPTASTSLSFITIGPVQKAKRRCYVVPLLLADSATPKDSSAPGTILLRINDQEIKVPVFFAIEPPIRLTPSRIILGPWSNTGSLKSIVFGQKADSIEITSATSDVVGVTLSIEQSSNSSLFKLFAVYSGVANPEMDHPLEGQATITFKDATGEVGAIQQPVIIF